MDKITITAARIRAGYTQAEVAKALGTSCQIITNIEKDCTTARLFQLDRLLSLYHIKAEDLYQGKTADFIAALRRGEYDG